MGNSSLIIIFYNFPLSSRSCTKILRSDMVYSFPSGVGEVFGETSEPWCPVSRLLVTLPCCTLHGLGTCPRGLLHLETLRFLLFLSLQKMLSFWCTQDTFFPISPLESSPNFLNDFYFYKYPEESLASSNFNHLLCGSYWGKKIPRAWQYV